MKFCLPLSFILSALLFGACSREQSGNFASANSPANASSNDSKKANDNREELGMLIRLADDPEDVVWREEPLPAAEGRAPGPADRRLTAVLLYPPAKTAKVISDAEKHGAVTNVSLEPADWYPAELISQYEISGEPLHGRVFPANDFFQAPYSTGRLIRIEGTDYIIVELSTK